MLPSFKAIYKTKLDPKTSQHVFLGYTLDYKGYICYNPITKKSIVSRHVIFHENEFPFSTLSISKNTYDPQILHTLISISNTNSPPLPQTTPFIAHIPTAIVKNNSNTFFPTLPLTSPSVQPLSFPQSTSPPSINPESLTNSSLSPPLDSTPSDHTNIILDTIPSSQPPNQLPVNNHPVQTRSKSGIFKPRALHVTTRPTLQLDPTSYTEASKFQHWRFVWLRNLQLFRNRKHGLLFLGFLN